MGGQWPWNTSKTSISPSLKPSGRRLKRFGKENVGVAGWCRSAYMRTLTPICPFVCWTQTTGPPQPVQIHRRFHRSPVREHHHRVLSQRQPVWRPAEWRCPHQLGLQVTKSNVLWGTQATHIRPHVFPHRLSFATDIARGMSYLHQHKVFHGRLHSRNCVIDDRWVCKISGKNPQTHIYLLLLFYKLLNTQKQCPEGPRTSTQSASFGSTLFKALWTGKERATDAQSGIPHLWTQLEKVAKPAQFFLSDIKIKRSKDLCLALLSRKGVGNVLFSRSNM